MCKFAAMDPQQIAQRELVRTMLARTGLTPTELARKAGLTPSTLTRFLNGQVKHALSARTLDALSAASLVPVGYVAPEISHPQSADDAERIADDRELAQWIATERGRRRWTQEALAALVMVSAEDIAAWEAGQIRPNIFQIIDLCGVFGVTVASFLTPGAPYHGHIITDDDELEVLTLWRRVEQEDRSLMLRLLRGAVSRGPTEKHETQRHGQRVDILGG